MSDSEKTDELDNYGVWVKKGPETVDSSDSDTTDFNMDMNLPDFSDLDVPDDSSAVSNTADVTDSFLSDFDTDLSDLVENNSAPADTGSTEDISLDEFISGGEFTDVAEGNRGFGEAPQTEAPSPKAAESSGGEESVSLDDFLDMDSLSDAPAEESTPVATTEEAPLDIDLSFDDSADDFATETEKNDFSLPEEPASVSSSSAADNSESIDLSEFGFGDDSAEEPATAEKTSTESTSVSADSFDDMFNSVSESTEIDASAFFDDDSAPAEPNAEQTVSEPAASSGEEEVDLSDFGFDDTSLANQGEVKDDTRATPIGSVDYEMNVIADDDLPADGVAPETVKETPSASAPTDQFSAPVTEEEEISVPTETEPETEKPIESAPTPAPSAGSSETDDFDLDALMNNITDENGNTVQIGEPSAESTETFDFAEEVTAEEPVAEEPLPEMPSFEEPVAEEQIVEEPTAEEPAAEMPVIEEPAADDIPVPDTIADFEIETTTEEPPIAEDFTAEEPGAEEIVMNAPSDEPVAETERAMPETEETPATEQTDSIESPAATAILSQIVGELTSLKNEIASLKNDFETMKNHEFLPQSPADGEIPQESTGFFDDTGEDDTIALSTDELANIMNTADFETEQAEEPTAEAPKTEDALTEEPMFATEESSAEEEPALEETFAQEQTLSENELTEEADSDAVPLPEPEDTSETEESSLHGDATLSTDELAGIMNTADFETEHAEEPTLDEASLAGMMEPTDFEAEQEELSSAPLEEPTLDDISFDESDSTENLTRDLPDEISLPKVDDVLVEPSSQDLIDEENAEPAISDDSLNYLSSEATTEEIGETTSTDADFETPAAETIAEVLDNTEAIPEEEVVSDSAETPAEPAPTETPVITGELKQEIKSVLSYMDKLLENLPEEKIAEFAQSEQFETYKKLFKELGLA